jgi:hypothetical protein
LAAAVQIAVVHLVVVERVVVPVVVVERVDAVVPVVVAAVAHEAAMSQLKPTTKKKTLKSPALRV